MRQLRTGLASLVLAGAAVPALAQQGSVQVSASGQTVTGNEARIGTEPRVAPDVGVVWLQPGSSFSSFQLELRGTRRGQLFHPGRMYAALRDLKHNGIAWTFEAGDAYFTPALSDYKFSNLFAPQVTFTGGLVSARTRNSSLSLVGGRTAAWRNVFGSDPDTLGQVVGFARVTHKINGRVELNARASRIRTTDLKEFTYTVSASDQGGGGVKFNVTPALQVSADAGLVSYRRAGRAERERDVSAMVGASWLHRRGWLQVNASRFAPGEFAVLNYPLQDRETLFGALDYDLFPRVRLYAGGEAFRSNLDPERSAASTRPTPRGDGARAFGGFRFRLASRTTLTVRAEQGDRRARPVAFGRELESDTGMYGVEWQMAVGRVNAFARFARRENVDRSPALALGVNGNGTPDTSYTQHDSSAQLFVNMSRSLQLFGTASLVRHSTADTANTYVQLGGGVQLQIFSRDLWFRAEGTAARNVDLLTNSYVPRETLNVGLNGRLTRLTSLALNVNVDRSPFLSGDHDPWMTRSTLRVIRTIPTGASAVKTNGAGASLATPRGSGTIAGTVFADWNGNGTADPGENTLDGIAVRVIPTGAAVTGRDGRFSFTNVPVGLRRVGLDTSALPVDFDPPEHADVELEISRGETRRVSFGLIPLGAIIGRVVRDANGNGVVDDRDEPIGGAVVILDEGVRSEEVRKGRYRFDAVRGGKHVVELLIESLPAGAAMKGDAKVTVMLARERMTADVPFLIALEKRPEIRRVFPPKGGGGAEGRGGSGPERRGTGAERRTPGDERRTPGAGRRTTGAERRTPSAERFAIQIAALVNGGNAEAIVHQLRAAGLAAYLVRPEGDDPFYRVRVGPFTTRAAAERARRALMALRQEQLWVMRVASR